MDATYEPPRYSGPGLDFGFVDTIAEQLTDEHYAAVFQDTGIADSPEIVALHAAAEGTGVADLIRTRLAGAVEFDLSGCAQGAGMVALGVASAAAGLLTGSGALVVSGVTIAKAGAQQMVDQC
jgi:hypothetical protein